MSSVNKLVQSYMDELSSGNKKFKNSQLTQWNDFASTRSKLSKNGQKPKAVVLTCSDSRVVPELIFDQSLGDLFVIRTAGNSLSDHGLASIEYAVGALEVPLLIILGHTQCGAIAGALSYEGKSPQNTLEHLLTNLKDILLHRCNTHGDNMSTKDHTPWIKSHVQWVKNTIQSKSNIIHSKIKSNQLMLMSALYHLDSGQVELLKENDVSNLQNTSKQHLKEVKSA